MRLSSDQNPEAVPSSQTSVNFTISVLGRWSFIRRTGLATSLAPLRSGLHTQQRRRQRT